MGHIEIKEYMRSKGIKQWEVAEYMGVSEFTLSRWLRRDPNLEKAREIIDAINHLALKDYRDTHK